MKSYGDEYFDNPNQRVIDDSTYMFIETLNSVEGKDIYIDDISAKAYITNTISQNSEVKEERTISVLVEQPMKTGDYIKGYDDGTYLVTSDVDNHISHKEAKIRKCNQLLKWMYKGNLFTSMSITTNQTKYTLGTDSQSSAGIIEADSRFQIQLPYNDITKTIQIGQRHIFNDGAWKVTQTDRISQLGLYNLLLGQDSINDEIDDRVNEIAGAKANKHTYTYNIPTSIEVSKDNSTTLVYSIVDETGKDFDYSLVNVKNTSNLIQVDNNKGIISIKGLDIGVDSITLSVPSGEVSKDFTISFEVKSVVPDKIEYKVISSNAYTFIKMVGAEIRCEKLVNGVADTTLKIDYKVPTNIQALITNGSLSITTKSDNSIYIRNKSVTTPTTFVIEFFDKVTGTKIAETQTITLKGV